jgi:UDP-N-acetylmuramyl pentapeptide phosphotransferase/UDP-N-acetylglucosamine-1-phosphate transferase
VWWAGLALAAGIIGFLPYNFPRARIFLGDVGSGALGYALAALFAWGSAGEALHGRLLWSLPLLPFLLDASLTLASRILAGEAWWRPHVTHAYQAWARSAGSHVPVTLAYVAAATVAALAMFAVRSGTATIIITVWLVVVTSGALAWKTLRGAAAAPTTGKVGKGNR